MDGKREKVGEESEKSETARDRSAHALRFKSSEKCADHVRGETPKRFYRNTF